MKNIELEIINLKKKIKYLDYYYYILNKSIISDIKYDKYIIKLDYLENKYPKYNNINSPTKSIYNAISKNFKKYMHLSPMLSLKNTYLNKDLIKFNNNLLYKKNIKNIKYCCEIKLDGIAINLIYKNGILFKALTRGNGIFGEDVTKNIKFIKNIPIKLKINNNHIFKLDLIEIRGEICISNNNLNKINDLLIKNKKKIFKDNRSAVSGIIRNYKNDYFYINFLDLFCYGIGNYYIKNKKTFKLNNSHFKLLKQIKSFGFNIFKCTKIYKNIKEIENFYKKIENIRNNIKYKIDGIVIKVDCRLLQNILGYNNKYPNWAIAYKFESYTNITKLIDIVYNVGRTGIITPIAVLEPVIISGILIKNVSLYNLKKIKSLDLMIGDKVIIKRSGDAIPIIYKTLISERKNIKTKKINFIEKCPSCNSKIIINLNKLKCESSFFCKSQIKHKIIHFFSEKSIFIPEIDKKLINKLINKKIINSPIDVFKLNFDLLNNLNINKNLCIKIDYIFKKKIKVNLENFIYSLSIEGIGEKKSIILSKYFKNINNLIDLNNNNLIEIKKINKNIYNIIINFFKNKNNLIFINTLINNYISIN